MLGFSFTPAQPPDTVAAVDLGSNSFHLIVARVVDGQVQIIDRVREMVRLAAGLDETKLIADDAQERAIACLERFGQRLSDMPRGSVRAVGTNTLRAARNGEQFRRRAQAALGHPIEVIAGREEARLIYLGVAQGLQADDERRLVVDIGGGSTELIVGEGFKTVMRESVHMGCVSTSVKRFSNGEITARDMSRAILDARLELRPIQQAYLNSGWHLAIGSSGSIKSIGSICREAGLSEDGSITLEAMHTIRNHLVEAGHVDKINLPGLSDERRPVFAGGFAVLMGVFEAIGVQRMQVSKEALREGLLYDLLGRIRHEDARERTVNAIAKRFSVDVGQAERVARTAQSHLDRVGTEWGLDPVGDRDILRWAATLHELGLAVSHTQYHKHGGYLLAHADLSGFSRQDQRVLAALVRGHRRKFPLEAFEALPEPLQESARRLCLLLRLAVVLHRERSDRDDVEYALSVEDNKLRLSFPEGWLDERPLTAADLKQEASRVKAAGYRLKFK
ncbi:MAG: exopolyphosphatase [Gammaproteobacteria bacterium]|nr:exopolyphosphatase [Gammaproteobacteria bacterium]MCP5136695.1 exopolyphosphatase [Gammaproteobacteria bacterium]